MVNYKKLLVISLILTILVFSGGFLLGLSLDSTRISDLVENLNQNELSRESYLVESEFIKNVGGNICDLSKPRVFTLSNELGTLGQLLTRYESKGIFRDTEYNYLKRKYFLLEIRTYSLFVNLKKECGYDFNTILYFYDQNEQSSINQGYILDSLVGAQDDLHVFSFDRNFDEPSLNTLKIYYNVTSSPTLIINDKLKKEGLSSLDELKAILK